MLDTESEQNVIGILGSFESVANEHVAHVLNKISEIEKSKKLADEEHRDSTTGAQRGFLDAVLKNNTPRSQ